MAGRRRLPPPRPFHCHEGSREPHWNHPKKTLPALLIPCALLPALQAQQPTQVGVFFAPGSQLNTPQSCLIMSARATAPGALPSPVVPILGLFSPSGTFAAVCDGGVTGMPPGSLDLFATVEGGANQPFLLAVSVVTGSLSCGGPSNLPCLTGPSLFNSIATPMGLYHLDLQPFIVLDGLGLGTGAPPAVLGTMGTFPLPASLALDTAANSGAEKRLAIQVATADPTHPAGVRLSSCFNCDQGVDQP